MKEEEEEEEEEDGHSILNVLSFQLNGEQRTLAQADVESAMRGQVPEPSRAHVVEVGGIEFPVKQAFSAVTGLDRLDFTTNQARTIFKRLGLTVRRLDETQ